MKPWQPYTKTILWVFLTWFMFLPVFTKAQVGTIGVGFEKSFNSFTDSIAQKFESFSQKNDSIFLGFLSQSWKVFGGVENKMPTFPKPTKQPIANDNEFPATGAVYDPSLDLIRSDDESPTPVASDAKPDKAESIGSVDAASTVLFYGSTVQMPVLEENRSSPYQKILDNVNRTVTGQQLPKLNIVNNIGISTFFSQATQSVRINKNAKTVWESATKCKLNDWGFVAMLMAVAPKLYPDRNEQVLFTWYALIRNGFMAKVGYNRKKQVCLLLPVTEKVFSKSFIVEGIPYYFFDMELDSGQQVLDSLFIYERNHPDNLNPFSFVLKQIPQLGNENVVKMLGNGKVKHKINKDLIDFYDHYPSCELKVFFSCPLSETVLRQLDGYFNCVLINKNDDEKVAYLLSFIQKGIQYQTDQEQFGRERYLFAEETLYYPAADCEDRAVLLGKLIRHYTSLKTIGLFYTDHVSLAVNLGNIQNGKCFNYNNMRFYSCDPTFLGSQCGQIMPKYKNIEPEIIDY